MADYRVNLNIYNGPLDLLLYLIRRDEIDIYDIPIAQITDQYLQYVDLIKELNLEQAGEFLVMAATLMEVKSAMLLPREQLETEQDDDLGDPRLELVRQLLEYKKFKDLAGDLSASALEQASRFSRPLADLERLRDQIKQDQELEMESLQIWNLFDAFSRLMEATLAGKRSHEVIYDETPIDIYETEILYRAQQEVPLTFEGIFRNCKNRGELVGMFLALLELVRQKLIRIEQEKIFGPIYIFALTEEEAEKAVAHAVSSEIDNLPSKINIDRKQVSDETEPDKDNSQNTEKGDGDEF
ncbi:MAG: segregation/condensation protein A [Sedimentisphaerales bacterium]|nr:segregation/condensation protein A [Sedimentisphaerales bacterium]